MFDPDKIETLTEFGNYLSKQFVVSFEEYYGYREWLWLPPFAENELEEFWTNLPAIPALIRPQHIFPGTFFSCEQYPQLLKNNHSEDEIESFISDRYDEGLKNKPYVISPSGYDAEVYENQKLKYTSKGYREDTDVPAYEARIISGNSPIEICSGGQTGVDRGALDAALKNDYETYGWCPKGRLAEDGTIPARYKLEELKDGRYRQRTLKNIVESNGTLIIYWNYPTSGTQETLKICINKHKPYKLIDATLVCESIAAQEVYNFILKFGIGGLNVAGPRGSSQPLAHSYTETVIDKVIDLLNNSDELVPKPINMAGYE